MPTLRTAQRQSRQRMLIIGAIVLIIVVGLGLYIAGKGNSGNLTGNNALPTTGATGAGSSSGSPRPTASGGSVAKKPATNPAAGYTLTAAATAGGYPLMAAFPAYVQGPASTTAQAVRGAAVTDGGKITRQVSGAYQLSGGQVMSFYGYDGKFSTSKVIASLSAIGTNVVTYSAGKDGGKLACGVTSSGQSGTFCVWVTPTTLGVTEFFSSTAPEAVLNQAKTASDTRNFRAGVEQRKS